jgi:hypothetical protein
MLKKTKYGWLQPTNAVQVAQSLLKTDKTDFQLRHQQEAFKGICVLEKLLCGYLLPTSKADFVGDLFILKQFEF